MVFRADIGYTIENYVLVKNVNDVPVNITLSASGDLAEDIKILNQEFTLQPGEDKKAYFTLEVTREGQTEGKIDIEFIPEEGDSISLSSTIIVIVDDYKGFCEFEEVGGRLKIAQVKINERGYFQKWDFGEDVEMEVRIENLGEETIENVIVELGLFNEEGNNIINEFDFSNIGEWKKDAGDFYSGDKGDIAYSKTRR
jgi:uncharacterized membrane protein